MAGKLNLYDLSVTFLNDVEGESQLLLEFAMHLVIYAAIAAIFLMIIALVLKLLGKSNGDEDGGDEGVRASENTRLLSSKEDVLFSYGTGEDDDYSLESGKGSCSISSDDLCDGKICIICYDDQRSCFFVPCGHSIACHTCANRIVNEESKSCPICRGHIHKVRKLYVS